MVPTQPQLLDSISARQRPMHRATAHMNEAAAEGISQEYARLGGKYVPSVNDLDPKAREYLRKKAAKKREEEKEKENRFV